MSGNSCNFQFCSHFISHLRSLSLWIADIVYYLFCLLLPCHINRTAFAFADKGSHSYNSGKSPLHPDSAGLVERLSVLLSSSKMHPCSLLLPLPSPMKGACFYCLTWIWMWGAGVKFTLLLWNPFRASDTCTLQGDRDLGHCGLSLVVDSPVKYLKTPSCNPQAYPAKPQASCQSWNTQHILILTTFVSLFLKLCVNCFLLCLLPMFSFKMHLEKM